MLLYNTVQRTSSRVKCHAAVARSSVLFCASAETMQVENSEVGGASQVAKPV